MRIFVAALMAAALASGQAAAQTAVAGSNSNSSSGSIAGSNSSVNIQNGRGYRSTGAAFAPSLAIGGFSCQGSVSAGAGGAGWGVAFGTTVMDRDCNTRENAKVAAAAFGVQTGRLVLCNIAQIAAVASACQQRVSAGAPAAKPRTLFGYQAPSKPLKTASAGLTAQQRANAAGAKAYAEYVKRKNATAND